MENASKALLMAGGVLMAILVISMLVLMFSDLTNFFSEGSQSNKEAQIVKFNLEYESYNREDVRGTEILSLLAKVQDYNEYQSDYEGIEAGYSPITVSIKKIDVEKDIKYGDGTDCDKNIESQYTQNQNLKAYDDILDVKNNAKSQLSSIGGSIRKKSKEDNAEITDSDLETLASSISLIESAKSMLNANSTSYTQQDIKTLQKTLALMQKIFNPQELKDKKITDSSSEGIVELENFFNKKNNYINIMNYTKQYYQYKQFKKARFKCTSIKYDSAKINTELDSNNSNNTGRICKLEFEYTGIGD